MKTILFISLFLIAACNKEESKQIASQEPVNIEKVTNEELQEEIRNHDAFCKENKCEFTYGETEAFRVPELYRTGYIPNPTRYVGAKFFKGVHEKNLPDHFDWREQGITPVKNQKSCGSCWAFGTASVVEDVVAIRDKKQIEIAKQYMVDCEPQHFYGCSGGDFAFKKLMEPMGAVYESEYPIKYVAKNKACQTDWLKQSHYYEKIEDWGYVGGANREATVKEMQIALITHGPLGVTIAASGLGSYKSGYYNNCVSGNTNHIVTIVGYVTYNNEVYWIMKNSWGDSWGENGYMKILAEKNGKKCNRIGEEEVTYVQYKATCSPQPESVAGPDQMLVKMGVGSFVKIGMVAKPDTTYSWSPSVGLSQVNAPSVFASPSKTTRYTLTATTKCGSSESTVLVRVFSESGREITE